MNKIALAAALAGVIFTTPAVAQDTPGAPAPGEPTAPDGSKAFGIEPYFGVMGGWEGFDRRTGHGIPDQPRRLQGSLVQGVLGVNVPLGPLFVGAEGMAAKGVRGEIDWEYGASGRIGFRAGDSGLLYAKAGYQWTNFDHFQGVGGNLKRDYKAPTYGIGVEAGPKDVGLGGLTGRAGVRLRLEVSTFGNDFGSLRPMGGVIAHF